MPRRGGAPETGPGLAQIRLPEEPSREKEAAGLVAAACQPSSLAVDVASGIVAQLPGVWGVMLLSQMADPGVTEAWGKMIGCLLHCTGMPRSLYRGAFRALQRRHFHLLLKLPGAPGRALAGGYEIDRQAAMRLFQNHSLEIRTSFAGGVPFAHVSPVNLIQKTIIETPAALEALTTLLQMKVPRCGVPAAQHNIVSSVHQSTKNGTAVEDHCGCNVTNSNTIKKHSCTSDCSGACATN